MAYEYYSKVNRHIQHGILDLDDSQDNAILSDQFEIFS